MSVWGEPGENVVFEFLIGVVLLCDFSELLQLEFPRFVVYNYGSNVDSAKAFQVINRLTLPWLVVRLWV